MIDYSRSMIKITNVLLCLMCLGFMNQGTLITLILFVIIILKGHGRIPVGNQSEFGILILFALSLVVFGMIGGMQIPYIGLLLPIGYCIGSSLKYNESDDLDTLILWMAISMDMHLILNLVYEIVRFGFSFRVSAIHYDIWSGRNISATGAMVNATPLLGCIYYLIFKGTRKKRIWGISLLVVNTLYDLIMGGRSFLVILIVGVTVGFIVDTVRSNGTGASIRKIFIFGSLIAVIGGAGYFILRNNSTFQRFYEDTYFFKRFFRENAYENIMSTGRISLRQVYLSNMWNYPFGGRQIWNIAHQFAHELYLDVYDIGGVVPYICIIVFVLQTVVSCFKYVKLHSVNNNTRILLITFIACMNIQFFFEPILSGAPILLVIYCILAGYIAQATKLVQSALDR